LFGERDQKQDQIQNQLQGFFPFALLRVRMTAKNKDKSSIRFANRLPSMRDETRLEWGTRFNLFGTMNF
jgi:hypothetical protein